MKLSERLKFDDHLNLAYIDGHPVSGEVFDVFTTPSKPGHWFRIVEAEPGGVIVVNTKVEASQEVTP